MTRNASIALALVTAAAVTVVIAVSGVLSRDGGREAPVVDAPVTAAAPEGRPGLESASTASGVPLRALMAYVNAAQTIQRDDPSCRLGWNTLAGIGSVESIHGAFGGATLNAGGLAKPLIIGLPLDGTAGNRAIDDTDGGELDGDERWDRAVGPMQFIPTTWERWGADGDGDGRKDPHDIDDAALAAGRYLCDAGGDMGGSEGWSRAVLTYNQSVAYATKVAKTATTYAEAV